MTAQAIHDAQQEPKPPLTTSLLVREQTYGDAEGKLWTTSQKSGLSLEEHYAQGIYPILHNRSEKFPNGESVDDLGRRATQAINDLVMPHVWSAAREGMKGAHIAVVSHGLCISEMVPALLRKDHRQIPVGREYRGLRNTGWTRVTIDVEVRTLFWVHRSTL